MAKHIAIVSYSLNVGDPLTADAVVFEKTLSQGGVFTTTLLAQGVFDETAATFMNQDEWRHYGGVVITNFYGFWNLRELILSQIPVLCANVGYVDDLGLGEMPEEHISTQLFEVVAAHPITAGIPLGGLNIGAAVFLDSTSIHDHNSVALVTTMSKDPVLVAHKTHKLVYFGWYRMSQASAGSPLFKLLKQAATWVFQ